MINDAEFTDIVRTFLEDGADRMPDRVYRAAMDVVPTTVRRRSPWWTVRTPTGVRLALGVAALLLVTLVGLPALIGGPSPTPTPSPSPTSTPVPEPSVIPLGGGDLHDYGAGT